MANPSNPALLLHALLSIWAKDDATKTLLTVRSEPEGWWAPHVRAVGWLDEVEWYLDATEAERDDEESAALDRLRRGVLATHWNMASSANEKVFNPLDLSLLSLDVSWGW